MNRKQRYQITKERNESDMICEKIIDTKPTDEISRLKGDVSRLIEENSNYEIINKGHKKINGELQEKLTKAEAKIKDFEKIKMYNEPHNIQN
jgi:regulator of replication initiation timing